MCVKCKRALISKCNRLKIQTEITDRLQTGPNQSPAVENVFVFMYSTVSCSFYMKGAVEIKLI